MDARNYSGVYYEESGTGLSHSVYRTGYEKIIMEQDIKYMKMALEEAKMAADQGEIPVGAVVVCQNRVIARTHNLTEMLTDVTAHAEMQAITSAANYLGGKYLDGCTLYVTLEPCPMCAGAIGWAQVSRLVYGACDAKRGYTKFAPNVLHPKATVTSGILAEECSELMKECFTNRR
mgnify:FL=1